MNTKEETIKLQSEMIKKLQIELTALKAENKVLKNELADLQAMQLLNNRKGIKK